MGSFKLALDCYKEAPAWDQHRRDVEHWIEFNILCSAFPHLELLFMYSCVH